MYICSNKMKEMKIIEHLKSQIEAANTNVALDRQIIANACKEMYKQIEEDVYVTGNEWMLKGMYTDLCTGNFAEPFMCEQKKGLFSVVYSVYTNDILPNINN